MNEIFLELIESKTTFIQEMYNKIARNPFPSITDLNKKFVTLYKFRNITLMKNIWTDTLEFWFQLKLDNIKKIQGEWKLSIRT